jgi:DNA-binding response OmpR family regulator
MAHIVIIEDQQPIARLYEINLSARDHTVIAYDDGELGLAGMRTQKPDIVLLNMLVPGELSGWDLLNIMRDDDTLRQVPTIIITGAVEEYERTYEAYPQVKEVLLKPFNLPKLLDTVDAVLRQDGSTT